MDEDEYGPSDGEDSDYSKYTLRTYEIRLEYSI